MATRLILGSSVIAGLAVVGIWLQASVVAQQPVPRDRFGNIITATEIQDASPSNSLGGKTKVEIPATRRPAKPTPHEFRTELKTETSASAASDVVLQDTYLDLHKQIAERLTSEQLTAKCKVLKKELDELIAEDEIEQIQKHLSELKQKNADHKGISTRLQRAIDSLKSTAPDAGPRDL